MNDRSTSVSAPRQRQTLDINIFNFVQKFVLHNRGPCDPERRRSMTTGDATTPTAGGAAGGMANVTNPSGEGEEFPILCETCLGPNPYIRMQRDENGRGCKVCERPFTMFRWRPGGPGMRPKKTEICVTCARAKNVCQTCILDLSYNLPVQVRDVAMASHLRQLQSAPSSTAVLEYTANATEKALTEGKIDQAYQAPLANNALVQRLNRPQPRYERNRARICSFFLRGTCTRGLYCPYRHERPEDSRKRKFATETGEPVPETEEEREKREALSRQNLRDRYYGMNDPVAEQMLDRAGLGPSGEKKRRVTRRPPSSRGKSAVSEIPRPAPLPPDDSSIKTLFIAGIVKDMDEQDVRALFDADAVKQIEKVSMKADRGFAFVEFATRSAAQRAMTASHGASFVDGRRMFVSWRKPKVAVTGATAGASLSTNQTN